MENVMKRQAPVPGAGPSVSRVLRIPRSSWRHFAAGRPFGVRFGRHGDLETGA